MWIDLAIFWCQSHNRPHLVWGSFFQSDFHSKQRIPSTFQQNLFPPYIIYLQWHRRGTSGGGGIHLHRAKHCTDWYGARMLEFKEAAQRRNNVLIYLYNWTVCSKHKREFRRTIKKRWSLSLMAKSFPFLSFLLCFLFWCTSYFKPRDVRIASIIVSVHYDDVMVQVRLLLWQHSDKNILKYYNKYLTFHNMKFKWDC